MANDTEFNTIKDLSCQSIPTMTQPAKPKFATYKFKGNIFADVKSIANIKIMLLVHLMYHDKSPLGVTFLNTLLEFNFLILSSSFSLIGSIALSSGILFINSVDYIICCYKTCTLRHIFQSSSTYVSAGTPYSS